MSSSSPLTSTTTIPADPTINTSTSSSPLPPHPYPQATPLRRLYILLRQYFATLARSTDRTLLRLSKLLSTPGGTDALLCTVGYLLDLLSTLLSRTLARIPTPTPTAALASKSNVVVRPHIPTHTQRLAQLSTASKALASTIADFRIFVRLWGLVGIYTWARSTYNLPALPPSATPTVRTLRAITWTQVYAGIAFQVLENGAYLASKGAIWTADGDRGKKREARWWVWSSRFWAMHVGLEFLRLGIVSRSRSRRGKGNGVAEKDEEGDGEKEGKIMGEERRLEDWCWWRDAVSNAAYAPMTLHWSVEEGLLSELGVGVLGVVAGGTLLVDAWAGTK
ncbi:hypothetical protein K505DRAFT_411630 [Melanomma pulvis-pyrius CBS 109.77]|uniref:Peroxin 11C n=1 Tax=Melanomma pulvis-pyrius CBS 109.77 TaxID=1314802 RepID=A0A6A6WSZ0_9PLEO|nr:hypothetical protein K505DRAFT_411630 [Melanomma pulvis-pyrius CBS 109.77]